VLGQPWLAHKSDYGGQQVRYATLSHRWGTVNMPKLLRTNEQDLRSGIILESLPLSFREAIELCHYLDIKYLWIDSLCLIQDDEDDRAREIKKMGNIYRHSFCNFSALVAAVQPVGLFVKGGQRLTSAFAVRTSRKDHNARYYGYPRLSIDQLNSHALMKRGWVRVPVHQMQINER
jgi:hypothetical protein